MAAKPKKDKPVNLPKGKKLKPAKGGAAAVPAEDPVDATEASMDATPEATAELDPIAMDTGDEPIEDAFEEPLAEETEDEAAPAVRGKAGKKAVLKAPKPVKEKPPRPSQPVQTDKFGLTLIILILLALIANMVVWGKAGLARADQGFLGAGRETIQEWDSASQHAKILAFESRGVIAKEPGDVDSVVLNVGRSKGVHIGDIYRPSTDRLGANVFIEFAVYEVSEGQSRAWIIAGAKDSARPPTTSLLNEVWLSSPDLGLTTQSDSLVRKWEYQDVRRTVQIRERGDS